PVVPKRERNARNGFSRPLKFTPRRLLDGLTHPRWLWGFLRGGGIPPLVNWNAYGAPGATKNDIADLFGANTPAANQIWEALDFVRKSWPGTLVVKGILHPDDARLAAAAGADGIIVSNHGGRQIDCCPSPLEVFDAIRSAVGDDVTLMIDSGVR